MCNCFTISESQWFSTILHNNIIVTNYNYLAECVSIEETLLQPKGVGVSEAYCLQTYEKTGLSL